MQIQGIVENWTHQGNGVWDQGNTINTTQPELEKIRQIYLEYQVANPDAGYRLLLSMNIWNTWEIFDSIPFYAEDTINTFQSQEGFLIHSNELSRKMDSIWPTNSDQKWWVFVSDSMHFTYGYMWVTPRIPLKNNWGFPWVIYQLGYMEDDHNYLDAGGTYEI
ncbi:MAG: hypothetical protein U5Q03_06015 [Bacteroidota bacterium]|nr:hypothetical protein [Bacteroidota bacterium]